MKKKILSLLLAAALTLSLAPAALALGAFADVTDAETAQNIEVLRLMGVLEGDANGGFRPSGTLTRAEFCKMAVVLTGKKNAIARYATRTIFPDVRANYWAAPYINFAASHETGLIHGMPDGTFAPKRAITYGEAVAILTRLLGYTDKDTGGVWPDGYIALAGAAGMTKGLRVAGNATITRAQAAKLFVNALSSENDKGETLLSLLGYHAELTKDAVTLYSVDAAKGVMRTSDKTASEYKMANPMTSTALNNTKGWVVTDTAGKAVTFLPSTGGGGTAISDGAIIVGADGSTAGFAALTGGTDSYAVIRNGVPASASELRKDDVVIYSASANAILACDARVQVYYEDCAPSPAAPETITVLGGTKLPVMEAARQSIAEYKPGQNLTLLLTADGRVAGAAGSGTGSNAYAYVSGDGATVSLLCGDSLIQLALDSSYGAKLDEDTGKLKGEVVRISQKGGDSKSIVSLSRQSGVSGELNAAAGTLGTRKVASGALVFRGDKLITLAELENAVVPQTRIAFARTNKSGAVDLIVIKDSTDEYYARVTVTTQKDYDGEELRWITADFGPNSTPDKQESYYGVHTGDFVSFQYSTNNAFLRMTPLAKLSAVSASAWIGESAVNYGGKTYLVSDRLICYNRDAGRWFDSLEAAKAYGGKMDLYFKDGVIHAIEVYS